jgi:hypothetical protein
MQLPVTVIAIACRLPDGWSSVRALSSRSVRAFSWIRVWLLDVKKLTA